MQKRQFQSRHLALKIEERERVKMAKVKKDRTLEAFFESYDEISFDEADEAFSELEVDIGTEMVAFIRRRPELFVGMGCYSWVARKPTISSRVCAGQSMVVDAWINFGSRGVRKFVGLRA